MELEQSLLLLEPMINTYINDLEELEAYKNMIESSLNCYLISTKEGIFEDFIKIKIPTDIAVYSIDCNFYNTYKNKTDEIKVIHPKLNKIWLSSTDTRFDIKKTLQDIYELELSGFLEIHSKFLDIKSFMYFRNGQLLNVRFNDFENEEAITLLFDNITEKLVKVNFYVLPEHIINIYAYTHHLEYIEEDENIKDIFSLSRSDEKVLYQGMFPSGYFQIYKENGNILFYILNDKLVNKLDIYEPFYLAMFSLKENTINLNILDFIKFYKPADILLKPTSIDKNFIFFCPFCWNAVPQTATECPFCRANIANFTNLPYEVKLIIALNHPIADYRITALNVIKAKKIYMAKPFIKSLAINDNNPHVLQAALNTLIELGKEDSCGFLKYLSENHEYSLVRNYAFDIYRRYCI